MSAARPTPAAVLSAVRAQKAAVSSLFDALRAGSPDPQGPGVSRDTFGAGEQLGYRLVAAHADQMPLERRSDHAANMYMTLTGRDRTRPRLMTGSHLDSVPNGGNFDGAAGVLAGLVAQRALLDLGFEPACDITTMAIRAEESVWFQVSYIGSRSAFGVLPDGHIAWPAQTTAQDRYRPIAQGVATVRRTRRPPGDTAARSV